MYVVAVDVRVKPENVPSIIEATQQNHLQTRQEPGNLRFDVLRHEEDPNRFMLYEVYRDKAGFEAHQKTEHYLRWKETVKDWMAQPRQGVKYQSLFPESEKGW